MTLEPVELPGSRAPAQTAACNSTTHLRATDIVADPHDRVEASLEAEELERDRVARVVRRVALEDAEVTAAFVNLTTRCRHPRNRL